MSKKAIAIETLGMVTIFAILLIFLIIFAIRAGTSTTRFVEDSECSKNIMAHSFLLQTSGEAIDSDIYCPTKYYTISGKDDNEVKYSLAQALKTCWGTWGKGKLDLFRGEGYFCNICSVIDFKEENKQITGFSDYLTSTSIEPGSTLTYADYLTGFGSEKSDPQLINDLRARNFAGTIDTSKSYASIFVYAKGKDSIKRFLDDMDALGLRTTGGGITTGFALGVVSGIGLAAAGVLSGGTAIIFAGAVTAIGGIIGAVQSNDVDWVSMTMFTEYSSENLKKIGCQITPVKQDKIQGVSG
jgi:hypothetical protein